MWFLLNHKDAQSLTPVAELNTAVGRPITLQPDGWDLSLLLSILGMSSWNMDTSWKIHLRNLSPHQTVGICFPFIFILRWKLMRNHGGLGIHRDTMGAGHRWNVRFIIKRLDHLTFICSICHPLPGWRGCSIWGCSNQSILVGGLKPSEKYEFVSWDDDIPNTMMWRFLCPFLLVPIHRADAGSGLWLWLCW